MASRVDLIAALAATDPKLNITNTKALEKALNKAFITLLYSSDLEAVRAMSGDTRRAIADALSYLPTMSELKKISKAWDAKRTVGKTCTHPALVEDVVALMDNQREPFIVPKMTLAAAKRMSGKERQDLILAIENLTTPAQVKALVKKWDKHNKVMHTAPETEQRALCLDLLNDETEPQAPPPKTSRKKS